MEIQEYINQKKSLYENLLSFINDEEDSDDYFRNLLENFQAQRLDQNREELKLLLYLLLKISKNHHRTPLFFEKIQRIISHFKNSIKQFFTNSEIFNIFIHSKPILLFLISSQIIIIDETVIDLILKYKDKGQFKYCHFFYPEIQSAVEKMKDVYKEDIEEFDHFIFTNFEENRKIGENHYLICKLIREDSVEDFISYITENKINVTSKITKSIFETNSLLIKNEETTLIEYAAFFGSFQIFQYLLLNNATVKPSIWIYAIHGKNPEIIHLLEYNNITPEDNNYDKCYIESIKCHHNDIADYISNSFFNRIENKFKNSYFHYYNYFYFQDDLNTIDDFFLACEYDYFSIVDFFLNSKTASKNNTDIIDRLFQLPEIEITSNLFAKCTKLTEIKIPPSITKIEDNAFYGCKSLKRVSLPSGLKYIGNSAFKYCSSLFDITIPPSLTVIGESAFEGCFSIKEIEIPTTMKILESSTFRYCTSLNKINIPSTITKISRSCFESCSNLEEIEIPESVTKIGKSAFLDCESLKKITIHSKLNKISKNTFEGCESLIEISIPSTVKRIGKNAFKCCKTLKSIILPNVEIIESETFRDCTSLMSISIPSTVKIIEFDGFGGCTSLTEISLPSSLSSIMKYAFQSCSSLKFVITPLSLTRIDEFAFYGCSSLIYIYLSEKVDFIGQSAFSGCHSLRQIEIPRLIKKICDDTFYGCKNLKQVFIPRSVNNIGNFAFCKCTSLEQISDLNSVNAIGEACFAGCSSLNRVVFKHFIKIGKDAFNGCCSLNQIFVNAAYISSINKAFAGIQKSTKIMAI